MDLKTTSPGKTYFEEGKNKPNNNTTTEDLGFGYLPIKDFTAVTLHADKNYKNKETIKYRKY